MLLEWARRRRQQGQRAMGKEKGGFLAPKQIANRIKAKGLTKLRWYCQLCEKACRDENGYKCHTQVHLRCRRPVARNLQGD